MARSALQRYFDDYSEAHRTLGNQRLHLLGIPLIAFSLLGLLSRVGIGEFNLAQLLMAFVSVFYLWLDVKLALGLIAVLLLFWWGALQVSLVVLWSLFIVGWVLQFVGHYAYEKKSPKFLHNLLHIFVGPLWLFDKFFVRRGKPKT